MNVPERVAIFTDTFAPNVNGVARTLARLRDALMNRGADVRVYAPESPGITRNDGVRRFPGIPFWAYPELRLAWPSPSWVERDFSRWRPTLIHAATPFGLGLAARSVARRLDVPFVTSYHTSLSEYARFYGLGAMSSPGWRFLRWFHNSGRRTFVPTHATARELAARGFERLAVWSRGVDTTAFHPRWRSETERASFGAGPSDTVVAYIGRVAREKGIGVLLDAARRLQVTMPNVVVIIVGDGPYDEAARRYAPPGVRFLGRHTGTRLSAIYASADLFVFPSTTDTFGNVMLEAMASGLPVIGADVGPTRELLADGGGVFFPPGSPQGLAAAVRRMVTEPWLRTVCADAALRRARRAGWDAVFDALFEEYAEAIGHHQRDTEHPTQRASDGRLEVSHR